jgi:hypothetical protein
MTAVRITKVERHELGFFTAHVTASGADTIRVDNRLGSWTFTIDPADDPGRRDVRRREVLPWCAALLAKRVAAVIRGEATTDEVVQAPERATPVKAPTPSTADQIAARMAQAAAAAVKEAA